MIVSTLPRARRRLLNRRSHEVRDLTFQNRKYVVGVGRFPDGALAEVFTDSARASNDLADAARDAAVALSIAAQFGMPLEAIRAAVTRDASGEPAGIVGAVLDLLADEARQ